MNNKPRYSIVIPVYNAAGSLKELADRIRNVMTSLGEGFEVIMVDDGSTDNSIEIMIDIHNQDRRFKVVQLFRNFGQHNATICGLAHSEGDHIITIDSDLEHHPEDIPKLLEYEDHDIVIAQLIEKQHNLFKKVTSRMKDWFIHKLVGAPKGIQISSFRMFKKDVAKNMVRITTPYPYVPALMFFVSRDVIGVPIKHGKRKYGQSTYTLKRMIRLFSNLMINNSSYLLQVMGQAGILSSIAGFFLALYFIARKILVNTVVPGWTSLIVINLILGGMILATLGIIGEYLIRIINSTENRPSYIVRRCIK